jgi:hypothetical protein
MLQQFITADERLGFLTLSQFFLKPIDWLFPIAAVSFIPIRAAANNQPPVFAVTETTEFIFGETFEIQSATIVKQKVDFFCEQAASHMCD